MGKIGVSKVRKQLRQVLDWVEAGKELVVTRRGQVVARLVPPSPILDPKKAGHAAAAIRAMSKGATLGGLNIKNLLAEGRL